MNTTEGMQARVAAVARKPFVRRGAIAILVLIVLFGLIGYFVLPGLIKSKVESLVEEKLGRKLGIEAIEISPYSLEATVRGLKLSERDGTTPFVAFDALHVNVQAESIFRLAPVVRAMSMARRLRRGPRAAPTIIRSAGVAAVGLRAGNIFNLKGKRS